MSKTWRRNSDYSNPSRFKRKKSTFRNGFEEESSNLSKKEKKFYKKQNYTESYEDNQEW